MTDEELLNDLYYVKKNYDGVEGLYKKSKVIHPSITKSFVSEWLKKQQSNQVTFKKIEKMFSKDLRDSVRVEAIISDLLNSTSYLLCAVLNTI